MSPVGMTSSMMVESIQGIKRSMIAPVNLIANPPLIRGR